MPTNIITPDLIALITYDESARPNSTGIAAKAAQVIQDLQDHNNLSNLPSSSGDFNIVYTLTGHTINGNDTVNLLSGLGVDESHIRPNIHTSDSYMDPTFIIGGNGNDALIGGEFNTNIIIAGRGNDVLMGGDFSTDNLLIAGNGNDQLYGNLEHFDDPLPIEILVPVTGQLFPEEFNIGGNTLIAGGGNDLLVGLDGHATLDFDGNTVPALANVGVNFYGNTLSAGNGNDHLFGNYDNVTFNFNDAAVQTTTYGNTLTAGNGNDVLIGTDNHVTYNEVGDSCYMDAPGGPTISLPVGSMSTGGAPSMSTESTVQGNILTAGNGNDTLIGDIRTATFNLYGTSDYSEQFGSNILTAGNGNDTLIGDVENVIVNGFGTQAGGGGSSDMGTSGSTVMTKMMTTAGGGTPPSVIPIGNTLSVGSGNDTLVGAIENIDMTGTAMVNLFYGQDTFEFTSNHIGNDQILDMNVAQIKNGASFTDILEFTAPVYAETLTAILQDDHHGGTLVHLGGGTIDFTDIHYTSSLVHLSDITANIMKIV